MGIDGRGREGARRPLRSREGGRRPAQRAQYRRDPGEDAAARGSCRRRVPRTPAREGAGEGGPGLRCPAVGGEGGLPPSACLTWNQASPFRVIPSFHAKSWALFRRPTSFLPVAGTGQQQSRSFAEAGSPRKGACRGRRRWGAQRKPGPLGAQSEFLKPQSLECQATTSSLGAKCVCHYSRPPARAAFAPALRRSTPGALRGWRPLSSRFAGPTNRWGAPQTVAQVRAPSAGLAAATVELSLAPARGPRCAVQ